MTEMRDVDHTHPHTGEAFGVRLERGTVVADGGSDERVTDGGTDGRDDETDAEADEARMADVTHDTHEGATRAFERGTEGREDSV